ncbi:hypothetical protein E0500_039490 [Streptomyces sp. KM273126]|uniref:hypothetical protein n=1 Tax=Streptomyces sp. KM273126 TaxID=2545247 RepID=UPI00103FBBE7|nr:hypothetical protein [Streptomyces sp. KM273126]MBA2813240.1 hypothetical protein [Streptomyces sp. KM273126]
MRQWLQNLSDSLVDRLVPRAEAAAAQCWLEWRCVRGGDTSGCASTGHEWWQTQECCDDGRCGPWTYYGCADCR